MLEIKLHYIARVEATLLIGDAVGVCAPEKNTMSQNITLNPRTMLADFTPREESLKYLQKNLGVRGTGVFTFFE